MAWDDERYWVGAVGETDGACAIRVAETLGDGA
jgi:hypothetical protein